MERANLNKVEPHIDAVESAVDRITLIRRIAEVSGADIEEFDRQLNEICTKYTNRYAAMNEVQLAVHGMMEIISHGGGDEIMELFADKERE